MAMWKYVTRDSKKGTTKVLPTPKEIEKADEAVTQAMSKLRTKSRGKYNSYTPRQRAQIGQYAAENGSTKAAVHFSSLWKLNINESTARRLKSEYLQKLRKASDQAKKDSGKPVTVDTLATKEKKRPLLLGEEMDTAIQEYIKSLRTTGAVVNTVVVMAAAAGIVAARDVTKLREYDGHLYGGHIDITKSWARSLLDRMGYVK